MKYKKHHKKTAIVILGPTAVGKTKLAIEVAQNLHTEILSADSRQYFKEMAIGTAVPSFRALQQVPHHFIRSHSINDTMNAGKYEKLALQKAHELFKHKDFIVVCGGTGLYIKAFCEGIDHIPATSKVIEAQIRKDYAQKGLSWLQQELREKDPTGFSSLEQGNPQRLMRALSVIESTGQSIKAFQTGSPRSRPFQVIKIGLELPREQLFKNIQKRTKEMFQLGLEEEAKQLYPFRHFNALQTVGYKELFDYFENKYSREEALEKIIIHTRQYAKRQMTWFRKDREIKWFSPLDQKEVIAYINEKLKVL